MICRNNKHLRHAFVIVTAPYWGGLLALSLVVDFIGYALEYRPYLGEWRRDFRDAWRGEN